ncbi:hypothetical protein MACK_003701 [Theileria orientalis]|uniref:Uncharacterized protein n=1 Tax=Theileria orientalis TaxID=68886 RepID=A0A976SIR4_THEOR|nr:hypothetical protein MACK_003701 [Theileria orientalis]
MKQLINFDAQAENLATSGETDPKSGTTEAGLSPGGPANQQSPATLNINQSASTTPTPVPLDIDIKASSDHFNFEESGNARTYTAKDNFLISELRKGTAVIHTFEDQRYPYKVTVTEKDGKEDLQILFPSTGSTDPSENEGEGAAKQEQQPPVTQSQPAPVQAQAAPVQAQAAPVQAQAAPAQPQQTQAAPAQTPGAGANHAPQAQATQPQQPKVLTPARRLAVSSFTTPGQVLTQDHLGHLHQNFAVNLQFVAVENGKTKIIDNTQYKVFVGQDGYIFGFLDTAKCVEIKYANNTMWKIGEVKDYPTKVEFSITSPPHVLIATKNQTYTYRLVNRKWQLGSHITNVASKMDPAHVKIEIATDATCAHTFTDESKYTIKTFDELNIFYYEFYPDVYCAGVIYQNQYLWKYASNFGLYFPKRIYFHKDAMTVVVDFSAFYLVYKFDDVWKFDSKVDKKQFRDDQIELVTLDARTNSQVINDFTQYRIIEHYYLRQYKLNNNARCVSLRYMQKEVWARNLSFLNYYPKSLVYNINTGNFFIDFDAKWYYVYVFDQNTDNWYLVHKDETNKPKEIPDLSVGLQASQQANQSQNANPNSFIIEDVLDELEVQESVREMRSGSVGSDGPETERTRSRAQATASQDSRTRVQSGPDNQSRHSDIEVQEVREADQDSNGSDIEFVRKETQKARPVETSSPSGRQPKKFNMPNIEVQEVRSGHSSINSDMVVEEVRVGRKRNYESDVIVEEVRHGQYDSDDSDLEIQEIRRGQPDSDASDGERRAYNSDDSRVDVREVRRGGFDSDGSGVDVREVRHGDYDSDSSEFDVKEVRSGAYDSDASHFDVEEVRYASNTESSGMRVREVRHGDRDSDATDFNYRTRRGNTKHHGYRTPYEQSDYRSPYEAHSHELRHEYPLYSQKMHGQRYGYESSGYSQSGYDSYGGHDYLVSVDIRNKRSTDVIRYDYDRRSRCDIFTTVKPYLFSRVIDGRTVKWRPKGTKFPNKVVGCTDRYGETHVNVFFPKEGSRSHYEQDSSARYDSTLDSEMEYRRYRGSHTHTKYSDYSTSAERHMPAHRHRDVRAHPYKQSTGLTHPMFAHKEPHSHSELERYMGRHTSRHRYDPSAPFQIQYEYEQSRVVGVTCNGVRIWRKRRDDPYPESTKCISDILMIAIIFNKFHFHIYKFNGEMWNRIRASVERIVELDINKRSSTENFYYSSQNHISTYRAMEKYLFNKVKQTYLSGYRTLSTDIWATDNPTEYADKIIVNRHSLVSTQTKVTIHFINGCEVTYHSPGLMREFYKYRWSEAASTITEDIQIFTLDSRGGLEINNVTKFDIYSHWSVASPDSNMKGIYKYEVVFYQNVKCVKVRVNKRKIFKTNPRLSGNFPTKITFNLETNRHYFEFADDVYNYVFEEKVPSYIVSSPV